MSCIKWKSERQTSRYQYFMEKQKKWDILVGGSNRNDGRNVSRNYGDTLRRKMGNAKGLSSHSLWETVGNT